mgnify:CR=1 FL=1
MLSRAMIVIVYENRAEMTVCFRELHSLTGQRHQEVSQLHQDYQQLWTDVIEMGVSQKMFRRISKVAIKGLMGMFFYSFLWLKPNGPHSANEVGDIFSDLILHSLALEK